MTRKIVIAALLTTWSSAAAQSPANQEVESLPHVRELADSVAGTGSVATRTRRLVHWVNDTFTWSYTDYERRTPIQIIARRKGNCAELASVLEMFLDSLGVRTRWVREINVQPAPTPRRQQTAEEMVASRGKSYSVFGLQHNDHAWLEVWDDSSATWFPADPAYGVVGMAEWSAARLAMERRPKPRVAAVEPIAADMLVPFVVTAGERRGGPYPEDRTVWYVVDGFNELYGGRLSGLPSWPRWVERVKELSALARGAFAGQVNLHEHTARIAELQATYDALVREAGVAGVTWSRQATGSPDASGPI